MRRYCLALGLLALTPLCHAQLGAVTGQVTCADNNAPARLADVTLMPVPLKLARGEKPRPVAPMTMYTTRLDGSFTVPSLPPGRYYVVVHQPGYLTPTSDFPMAELTTTDETIVVEIAKKVPVVAVLANQVTNVDVRLQRGASVQGTVRFDDGTGAPNQRMKLERKSREGKWVPFNRADTLESFEENYGFAGLPAGEYRLATYLQVQDRVTDVAFGQGGSTTYTGGYILQMYDGDTFHEKQARVLKLGDGETVTGHDLTIPAGRLHRVSGTVTEERSGKPVNAGEVTLTDDDGNQIATAYIRYATSMFTFEFVPEGTYTVEVSNACEVLRQTIATDKTVSLVPEYKETTLRHFYDAKSSLIIQTDLTGVLLAVQPMAADPPR